ncbi:MAG: DNA double-strand break repair nuclease NurA [Cyanobacteriota bacterium]
MLDPHKVILSLEKKKNEFISCKETCSDELLMLRERLEQLDEIKYSELVWQLAEADNPGAIPTKEWDETEGMAIKFNDKFNNHTEARTWAKKNIFDEITFAVDGSQILPSKDFSPPVAAVQVAKYENFHNNDGLYTKDIDFEIISSKELIAEDIKFISKEDYVNFKRVEFELNTLIDYIKTSSINNLRPIVFLDGSLIFTFITAEGATSGNILYTGYIEKICELLDTAEDCKIPLIGFIDTSNAHDIVDMLKVCFYEITGNISVADPQILNTYLSWGDRTPVFKCDRPGVLKQYKKHKDKIYFTYLKTNKNFPARLEFQQWLFEDNELFEKIMNIVRSEIIIGNGYIYSIESADASAVITTNDKKQFYKIFSEFAIKNNLLTNVSQKSLSKGKRRY